MKEFKLNEKEIKRLEDRLIELTQLINEHLIGDETEQDLFNQIIDELDSQIDEILND